MDTDDKPQSIFPSSKALEDEARFARIDNALLQNERLSFRAIGVAAHLLSRPKDWTFSAESLTREIRGEGAKALRGPIRELVKFGYIHRLIERDDQGHFRTRLTFHESPTAQFGTSAPTAQKGASVTDGPFTDSRSADGPSTDGRKKGRLRNYKGQTTKKKLQREKQKGGTAPGFEPVALTSEQLKAIAEEFQTTEAAVLDELLEFNARKKRFGDTDQTFVDFRSWLRTDGAANQRLAMNEIQPPAAEENISPAVVVVPTAAPTAIASPLPSSVTPAPACMDSLIPF